MSEFVRYHGPDTPGLQKAFSSRKFCSPGAQRHTSYTISAELSQQDAATRWRIATGQPGQFPAESLELKIKTEGICILNKEMASILIMPIGKRTDDLDHGQSHHHYFL
jgi:hypothetical protein